MSRRHEDWNSGGGRAVSGWRWALAACALLAGLCWAGAADAREFGRPVRIGWLTDGYGPEPSTPGMRDGLLELGYEEDVDFTIGVRFTQGRSDALLSAVRDLLRIGVDIIVAGNEHEAKAALRATTEIPIVFVAASDPVGAGLVQSFAVPGGNVTGIADLDMELAGKRMEIFRDIVPGLQRVMYPYDAGNPYSVQKAGAYRIAAEKLGIELLVQPLRSEEEGHRVLARLHNGEVDGIVSPRHTGHDILGMMLEATSRNGIPTMFSGAFMVDSGGLASYGPSWYEDGRLAARIVDKIIKGADPGEIPVEVNNTIELVINLKVAEELGITVAPEVLYQADRIIR